MRVFLIVGIWFWLAGIALAKPTLVPETREITAQDVAEAIDAAVGFLKREQRDDGTWPEREDYAGGLTPLCTLALLHAGCGVDDPAVAKALTFLRTFVPRATYTTSLQTMVLAAADPKRDLNLILRNVKWLERHQHRDGAQAGMWAVTVQGTPDHTDNSMTHMAMLALYDAERAGVPVSEKTWALAVDYWKRSQNRDGSWGWGPGYPGTGSMTTAGIAALTIGSGRLATGQATVEGEEVRCCGTSAAEDHTSLALAWLTRNFSVTHNPGTKYWLTYYLYSLERAGRLTGNRFIGKHDWYRKAAAQLVRAQSLSGAWPSDLDQEHEGDSNVSTSFALMFLTKARRPTLFARVKHGTGTDWNRHPGSALNLVTRAEQAWRRDLSHQVIDLSRAEVEDLLEAPVLFLSGRDTLEFSDADKKKLRMYVDRGGFLFAEQACSGEFDKKFRQLMAEVFPEPDASLRPLPPDHPLWRAEAPADPKFPAELWGIERGCRTAVAYSRTGLACLWELDWPGRQARYPKSVQAQIKAARTLGLNIMAYATNRDLKYKAPSLAARAPDPSAAEKTRNALSLAVISFSGDCDSTPTAVRNLLQLADEKLKVRANPEPRQLRLTDPELFQHHLVVLHGRSGFQFTPAERKQLRTYLERGGMLFADSVCSSQEFTKSFAKEMKEVFPDRALQAIPETDPLFGDSLGGEKLDKVTRRHFAREGERGQLQAVLQTGPPQLEGLRVDDHWAVIFSPNDISCALAGQDTAGCEGYIRADAARIALNILAYSFHR